jgi:AraC-like DNA-binding protein
VLTRNATGVDEWAAVLSDSFVPLRLANATPNFRGSVRQVALGAEVTLTDVRTLGQSTVLRTERLIRREPRELYLFHLHHSGQGAVLQDERAVTLRPGSAALYDTTRPYRLEAPTVSRGFVLQVPRAALHERLGGSADLRGRGLPSDAPAVRVLAGFLRELAAASPTLETRHLAEFGCTAVDLLATTLRSSLGGSVSSTGRQALLSAVVDHVTDNLADPALTPSTVAASHGVSLRYLADLFAELDTSPAEFIRAARLKAAHRALVDPRQSRCPITAIAARCGFSDRTTFTRAFVRRYGTTPSELRAGARA